jgi:hypothetical protein
MEFSGRLAAFPPSDILQWVHNDRRSGALVIRRSGRSKRVYFERGNVVACTSDDPAEYYGQLLLNHGYIGEAELVQALQRCQRDEGVRLGVALREMGLLSEEEIQRTLRLQIEDAVCDVFLWKAGFFYFEEGEPPSATILPEPISTLRLSMEGARWVDELARIRRIFIHDNIVLRRGSAWPGEGLTPLQERIAAAVDGRANLTGLYGRVSGSHFRFLEAAYQLAVEEVLDIAEIGDEERTREHETGVYTLLIQQAASEQAAAAQHQESVPLEVLERLYPLWLDEFGDPPTAQGSLEFLQRCNGSVPLRELLAAAGENSQEVETLLLCLRQSRMALLPVPLEELGGRLGKEPRAWWRRLVGKAD